MYVRDSGLYKIIDQTKYAFSSFLLEIKQKMSILSFNLYVFIPYYTVLNNPRITMGVLLIFGQENKIYFLHTEYYSLFMYVQN